jgi:DNA repair exonuclease SbcCD nuclease subunit
MKIVFLTDLHIGAAKIPAEKTYHNLETYAYPELKDCQLLIIGGDFFDALLNLDGAAGLYAHIIIQDLRRMAKLYNFFIRGIRGTFAHDRNQLQHLLVEADRRCPLTTNNEQTVRLFTDMAVEQLTTLNLTLLYIPDDLSHDNLLTQARTLLDQHQLQTVDIIVHHGYCTHLLPYGIPEIPANTHSYDEYRTLYHGVMLNGHVHTFSKHKSIFSGGSFERLCHGEEEDKGFVTIKYDPVTRQSSYDFIINHDASIFKTFTTPTSPTKEQIELLLVKIKQYLEPIYMKKDIHVRIEVELPTHRQWVQQWMKSTYPEVKLTIKRSRDSERASLDTVTLNHEDLPVLTPANLAEFTVAFLKQRNIETTIVELQSVYPELTSAV